MLGCRSIGSGRTLGDDNLGANKRNHCEQSQVAAGEADGVQGRASEADERSAFWNQSKYRRELLRNSFFQ